jgi:hypothetical protein
MNFFGLEKTKVNHTLPTQIIILTRVFCVCDKVDVTTEPADNKS